MAKPGSKSKRAGKKVSGGPKTERQSVEAGKIPSAPAAAQASSPLIDQKAVAAEVPAEKGKTGIIHFIKSHLSVYTIAILAIMAVMLYIRIALPYNTVFTNWPGNYVNIAADDAPMQMRLVYNTLAHFPVRELYDPFTHYPYGSLVHFGPLFTMLIAVPSLILGLGHPSAQLTATVGAYVPAVLGALCAIPTYYVGKKLFGRNTGLLAAVILMFLPGQFLVRSLLGFTDHHVAEVLFSVATIAVLVYALDSAKKAGLSLTRIKDRDFKNIKEPLALALLSGIAFGCYMLSWPGGLLVGFMLFIYFVLQCIIDHVRGKPLDSTLIVAFFMYLVPMVMVLPYSLQYLRFDLVNWSLTQPVILGLALVGIGIVYAVSRILEWGKISRIMYPVALAGIVMVGMLLLYIAVPQLYGIIMAGLGKFQSSGGMLTVGEAWPTYLDRSTGQFSLTAFWYDFDWAFYISILAIFLLAYRAYRDDRPSELMFLVWSVIMLWATFTETRFTYYFAVNAALLTGFVASELFWIASSSEFKDNFMKKVKSPDDLSKFISKNMGQTLVLSMIVAMFILVAVWPVTGLGQNITTLEAQGGPGSMQYEWYDALTWMSNHTPDPQGKTVQSSFDYANGTYAIPSNAGVDQYNYPASAYGVMSWWDYGNVIEYVAHRIPDANPFQDGITEMNGTTGASPFFCSTDENTSVGMLDKLNSRYVVIDNDMAVSKFPAIQDWINDTSGWETLTQSSYIYSDGTGLYSGSGQVPVLQDTDKWNSSIMKRLYFDDADGMGHYRLVYDSAGPYYVNMKVVDRSQGYAGYNNPISFNDLSSATRMYDMYSNYTIASDSSGTRYGYDARQPVKFVKVFEKVKGASITGSAPADASNVTASLTLKTDWGREFAYTETAPVVNGAYNLVVSYPTEKMQGDGYSYGIMPEGEYTISYGNTTKSVNVSENAVMNGDTIRVA